MEKSKQFAFDVSITFVASFISMVLVYMVTVLLGRYLGPDSLGIYRMNSTIYSFAIMIGMVGIPAAMIKYVAEFKEDRGTLHQIITSGAITSLVLGIISTILLYSMSGVFARVFRMPELSSLLKMLSFVFPFVFVAGVLLGLLNGLKEMKRYNIAITLQSALLFLVTVPLIYYGFGVAGAIMGIIISSLGYCLYLIWASKAFLHLTFYRIIPITKKMIGFGFQIFSANVVDLISHRSDIILIGYFLTATDVGYYTAAIGLSQFFWLIPNAIQRLTYPTTSEYWSKKNQRALEKMIDKSIKYSACLMLPVALLVGFFGKEIITMIFRVNFTPALIPLEVLLIGTIVSGVSIRAIGSCMAGVGRPDINLKIVIFAALVGIGLNVLFIPNLGIVGAALATTITLIFSSFLHLFFIVRIIKIKIDFRWLGKTTTVTIFAIVVSQFLEHIHRPFVEIGIFFCYMMVILFWLLTKEDREFFIALIHEMSFF